jgi:hypothetical protein
MNRTALTLLKVNNGDSWFLLLQIVFTFATFQSMLTVTYVAPVKYLSTITWVSLIFSNIGVGWILVYCRLVNIHNSSSFIPTLENLYVISSALGGGFFNLTRSIKGSCDVLHSSYYLGFIACNPESLSSALPQDTFFCLMTFSIISCILMKRANQYTIYASWLISTGFVMLSIILSGSVNSIFFLCISAPLSAFIICELQRQNKAINLLTEELSENVRRSQEIHANEMRRMIGNVAHDLKTVLLTIFFFFFSIYFF